jgi:hypothetical protein
VATESARSIREERFNHKAHLHIAAFPDDLEKIPFIPKMTAPTVNQKMDGSWWSLHPLDILKVLQLK